MSFIEKLKTEILLCDGAMGSQIQSFTLSVEKDFWEKENCSEVLNLSRPDLIRQIHQNYYEAGADAVETNSFGGSFLTLGEFGLESQTFDINKRAAELACEARALFQDHQDRYVLGSIGPGTKLPTLGHIDYMSLENAFSIQAEGLIAGGVDGFLIETCQDPLQIKAALNGVKSAKFKANKELPILVQVTIETNGRMLVGTEIGAAATILKAMDVSFLGLNCATGPREMEESIKWLANAWEGFLSIQPNAGLPELVEGKVRYPLSPQELAQWQNHFIQAYGINMVGGCCGTTPHHIQALDQMLRNLSSPRRRPQPVVRKSYWVPAVASLYTQVTYAQENAFFMIGERCNANGSKAFKTFLSQEDWDGCLTLAKEQEQEGAHAIDLCAAYVGRDEVRDLSILTEKFRSVVSLPLVFDSTEYPVLQKTLSLYGGKGIINSIHFEEGEEAALKRLKLAKKFGSAVIALTIDEKGMAKDVEGKLEIAERLYNFACVQQGLPPSDLLFDPLTFTICTGNEEDRLLGVYTLEAIEKIHEKFPDCQILLGLSNISFGLKASARHVLNSVFLDMALKRGLTAAILHPSKIKPLHQLSEKERQIAEDLILDRRTPDYDPLHEYIKLFEHIEEVQENVLKEKDPIEERLKKRIVAGQKKDLEQELSEALEIYKPLDIINNFLLDGMKVVGELFGQGKMQLPFVLQSAEVMKKAVSYLEPYMDRIEGQNKGTIILATVKGDVHDIGKNLVDIILTNNGYKVINLGIKQPIQSIIDAIHEHKPDAVGLSGLLVKSTVVMKENLQELKNQDIHLPVILGGAALTRAYVEDDCRPCHSLKAVAYAQDAFEGLELMQTIKENTFLTKLEEEQKKRALRPKSSKKIGEASVGSELRPINWEEIRLQKIELNRQVETPKPPFWGAHVVEHVPLRNLLPFLNERMLYQFHWGFRKEGRTLEDYLKWAQKELRPILHKLLKECEDELILKPQACYGYWPCASEGNDLILFDFDQATEIARFSFPRQQKEHGLCIADFFKDISSNQRDVIGLQIVTIGQNASDKARIWFQENRYQDYLYLHGLGVEMAEALAEYVHQRIRQELNIAHKDALNMSELLQQGYQGSRYSFGYPACPNLGDQKYLINLLKAERIGLHLSEEDQLHPEQSTSAIVLHHPQARYFRV